MDVYRRDLPPELAAFTAKQYHGHRGIPPTMDDLVNHLHSQKRKVAAVKLERLVKTHTTAPILNPNPPVIDPSTVDREKFVGVWLVKEFEGHGHYKGQVVSHDVDMLGKLIFKVRYLDGDEEDLFFRRVSTVY